MLWVWGGLTLLLAASLGFMAGANWARLRDKWALKRARSSLVQLFQSVLRALDAAHEACLYLEHFPGLLLSDEQIAQFNRRCQSLHETVSKLFEQHSRPSQSAED